MEKKDEIFGTFIKTEQTAFTRLRPDLNGLRVKSPHNTETFLIDNGQKRPIPTQETYNRLFKDYNGIVSDINIDEIETGISLSIDALLAKGNKYTDTYLIENGVKRGIATQAVFNFYNFSWKKIQVIDQAIINIILSGPTIY